ncbi:hypothetical protein HF521_010579 [Silurus meridionalis]|uniref:Uncharacterized protein n=1 Tax=Silurus meridionalis TaxID=175797 RepID=A0A8T0AGR9_SILME|nr:hypothetical protein HF521_010579 [Silurus meridionalis]
MIRYRKPSSERFHNQKPWVDKTISDALRSRSAAYNTGLDTGDMDEYKAASYRVRRAVKEAFCQRSTRGHSPNQWPHESHTQIRLIHYTPAPRFRWFRLISRVANFSKGK